MRCREIAKPRKAQSAMEYLMTYGWAILIIAVVLGALFELGVFGSASSLPQGCIAESGYYCQDASLSTSGVLTLTIGQATTGSFSNVNVYFVPSGGSLSNAASASLSRLQSGELVSLSMQLPTVSPYPSSYALGTPLTGYVYINYTEYGTTQSVEIATLSVKADVSSSPSLQPNTPTVPSGIVAYVPITLSNSKTVATPAPFQQMVQFSESGYSNYINYSGKTANFEFFTASGSVIPAWIESNSSGTITAWLKLANGIPASNSITVYLGFASKTTNLLSSSGTSGIGEAPQLSSTYAQYDDGASVFNNYWNFASAPSGWTTYVQSGTAPTISTSGGLTMTLNTNSWSGYYDSSLTLPLNQIMEMYGKQSASVGMIVGWWTSSVGAEQGGATAGEWGIGATTSGEVSTNGNQGGSYTVGTYYVQSIYSSSSAQTLYVNYVSTATDTFTASASYPFIGGAGSSAVFNIYWLRTRAYPPNGVMPSVSFGAVQAIPPTLSLTSPIVYGQNDTITATTVSGDSLNLYINNYLAGTTTSGTLTVYLNTTSIWYNANLSAGTNYINASDATNGGYTNDTLIITQATPSQPTLLVNGTQTTTITYGGISTPISATNTTTSCMNSQCLWNIYYIYNNTTTLFNQTYTDNSNQFTTLNVALV